MLLLAFGVLIGPHALGIATCGEAVDAFRELRLARLLPMTATLLKRRAPSEDRSPAEAGNA